MEQTLSMNLGQKLAMTMKMQQAIQILQLSSQDLRAVIEKEYMENPALEVDEGRTDAAEDKLSDRCSLDEMPAMLDYLGKDDQGRVSQEDREEHYSPLERAAAPAQSSLEDILLEQANFACHTEAEKAIVYFIVGCIDGRGYFTTPLPEVARAVQTTEKKASEALRIIQGFEPSGVGARDLRECLRIQAERSGIYEGLVKQVIDHHLVDVAAARLKDIAAAEDCSLPDVQLAVDIIRTLNPKPGSSYGSGRADYIIPDVMVRKVDGKYSVMLNDAEIPHLSISPFYRKSGSFDIATQKYITKRLNAAIWLIKSIEQRQHNLKAIVEEIVRRQTDYLEKGPAYLHPLLMKTVAEAVGVHESTVSRAAANKYVQMPHGVIALRSFFSASAAGNTADDASVGFAASQVKYAIDELIKGEDPKKPFSDAKLTALLSGRGMDISRRTVMKYREQLGYQSSVKRKRY
jgi:RNA polymerase sigma-54 factor